jgi:hypothetical protein
MRQVEEGQVASLFVIDLQSLTQEAKCSPLFRIESEVGLANEVIQQKIDQVAEMTRRRIRRVFLASDGDLSYNDRHHEFMAFSEPIYQKWGLETVLEELKWYTGILPLTDLLNLGKNLRTRFVKYLLTFVHENLSRTTNRNKRSRLLGSGAPLTDLSLVGKMRDVYPLVIMRIEHMITLLQNNATAEALAWLPLSLCFKAVRLETITHGTRRFMLHVSFFMVKNLYDTKKSGQNPNPETSKRKKTRIFTSQWSIRFLNTCCCSVFR